MVNEAPKRGPEPPDAAPEAETVPAGAVAPDRETGAGERVYSLHKSVRGAFHVARGIPCQDSSDSFSDEAGRFHVVAVADGHGDPSCFRSDRGSRFAVAVAMDCLRECASEKLDRPESSRSRFFHDMLTNPRYRRMEIRRWTDTILSRWHERVREDYEADPPAGEELSALPERLRTDEMIPHIYGSTLMAALWFPPALILLHQGDGRLTVFFEDGRAEQPVPWDPRCEGVYTTSLCDRDAPASFRHCVLDMSGHPVMACWLGCDGVEDAFRDTYTDHGGSHCLMGGVHTFCKALSVELVGKSPEEMDSYLQETLPVFSERGLCGHGGSGDDISVAGIVRPDCLSRFRDAWRLDIRRYQLEEDLFRKNSELGSKARKHGILARRLEEARQKKELAERELKIRYGVSEPERPERGDDAPEAACADRLRAAESALAEARAAFDSYDGTYQAIRRDRDRITAELVTLSEEPLSP